MIHNSIESHTHYHHTSKITTCIFLSAYHGIESSLTYSEPSESSFAMYQESRHFYKKNDFFDFISSGSVLAPCGWFHRSVRMILRWFAPQHSSKLHLSSEIQLLKDDREGQIPDFPTKSHCFYNMDFIGYLHFTDFKCTYLGAQMELEGVLGL